MNLRHIMVTRVAKPRIVKHGSTGIKERAWDPRVPTVSTIDMAFVVVVNWGWKAHALQPVSASLVLMVQTSVLRRTDHRVVAAN
jgi:hypothetical protein